MSYKIRYGGEYGSIKDRTSKKSISIKILVLILSLGVSSFFVREKLFDWLIPGNNAVTVDAFAEFKRVLKAGETFGDAFEVFCREIIYSEKAS